MTTLTQSVPAHVPPHLVYDFDFNNEPGFLRDPQVRLYEIAQAAPGDIFYTPRNGGHWVVTSYQLMFDALRNPELFSSRDARIPGDPDRKFKMIPVETDPPLHTRYRTILNPLLSPKAVAGMEPTVRQIATELIDDLKGTTGGNFSYLFGEPMPIRMFMTLFGMPLEKFREYREIAKQFFRSKSPEEFAYWTDQILERQSALLDERRREPKNDIASVLALATSQGEPLSHDEALQMYFQLFGGGLDTVTVAFGYFFSHLGQSPDLQEQLRANPSLIPEAIEESLRRYTFVNVPRTVTRDTEFGGVQLKKGEKVLMALAIAGFDERKVKAPLQFDFHRDGKEHFAFGMGLHRCVGSHLARLELRVAAEEWLRRVDNFRVVGKPKVGGTIMFVIDDIEMTWDRID